MRMTSRLTLQQPVKADQGGGVKQTSYQTLVSVWGHAEAIDLRHRLHAQQAGQAITHRVTIRRPVRVSDTNYTLTSEWRVLYRPRYDTTNRTLQVITANESPDGSYWLLECREARP